MPAALLFKLCQTPSVICGNLFMQIAEHAYTRISKMFLVFQNGHFCGNLFSSIILWQK